MKKRTFLATLLIALLFSAVFTITFAQEAPDATEEPALPDEIVFVYPGLRPEGIEYDAVGERFLVGSLSEGTISQVLDDGTISPFIEDDDLVSTVGIHIDAVHNRLLVCNSDVSVFTDMRASGMAALAAYDLETGERLFYADLSALGPEGRFFANDVTVDADGTAYVTNSVAGVIYAVDTDGNASIFLEDDQLASSITGLNGIEYMPEGYLLAAIYGASSIFKIPIDDPSALTRVSTDELLGIDGMVLGADGNVVAVARTSGGQQIVSIASEDAWETATVAARAATEGQATTVAVRDNDFYYVNAYLLDPDHELYEIVRVVFPEEE